LWGRNSEFIAPSRRGAVICSVEKGRVLVADPVAPYGGAAFHDNKVWVRKARA